MENSINPKKFRGKIVGILALAVILGFFAGIVGEFFTKYYLANFAFFRDLYFTDSDNIGQKDIIIKDAKKVVVEQDTQISQVKSSIEPSVVGVFTAKGSVNLLDKIYTPDGYLGDAVILTSDGWLLSTGQVITQSADKLAVSYNNKNYQVQKIVKDELSKIVFLKIEAQNLPVIKLADNDNDLLGQQVLVYNSYYNQINLANYADLRYQLIEDKYSFVSSSQSLNKFILLNKSFPSYNLGAPVFNFQGEVTCFLYKSGDNLNQAIPIHYVNSIINQVLKDEVIKRPYLGINYINLGQVFGLSLEETQNQKDGALILANRKGVAINGDSPLKDKLVSGDIITSIEDQKITKDNNLIDILLEYKSGQTITLKYWHENKESEVSITL